jgi:hypothetical protein
MRGYQPHDQPLLVILIRPPVTSGSQATRYTPSGEAGETRVRNMAAELCLRNIFFMLIG